MNPVQSGAPASPASTEQVWAWLAEVEDPEIPVISIVDLGIVREVQWHGSGEAAECVVTITPTYSGCPATGVIARSVVETLQRRGLPRVRLETRITPAWTTDWMSEDGKRKLRAYGIAPPIGLAATQNITVGEIGRGQRPAMPAAPAGLACPLCGATQVKLTSQFGSTPCKALYVCEACKEPFDYFKCH
ncbi:MAG: phenylacetate-CoA oxygenase subunit PaaJ [Burkholderiaceae bacterium]|nr:phenylacetate-CoA oxygenase subunit PaaJ [Burkholderiaceae bacterium]